MTAMPTLAPRIGQLRAFKALGLLLIAVFALLLPVLAPDSATTNIAVFTVMYVGLATAWNIMGGYTGYISLGHAAFFGIGAYAFGLLQHRDRVRRIRPNQDSLRVCRLDLVELSAQVVEVELVQTELRQRDHADDRVVVAHRDDEHRFVDIVGSRDR